MTESFKYHAQCERAHYCKNAKKLEARSEESFDDDDEMRSVFLP
jgi:hypothetical protein